MKLSDLQHARVFDLSRPLLPGQEPHPWLHYDIDIEHIDGEHPVAQRRWYIVTHLRLSGHAGTHVEAPLHASAGGAAVGDLPVTTFFGEAVVLDLSDVPWGQTVSLARLQDTAHKAGGIRSGDIACLRFDWDARSVAFGGYPAYPAPEALGWLIDQGIKLLGIDSPGLEVEGDRALPNHRALFDRGIPLIESLVGLDQLPASRIWVWAVPLPIFGADAVPLRVLAFEIDR